MSFARVSVVALLCLVSLVGSAVAQVGTYSFCYQISGLPSETLDDPYSIAVNVTGTYNTTLATSVASKYIPAGQYYTLLTATGTRTILTRNQLTVRYAITALAAPNTDESDNRFYISNSSFPQFVDGNGLTFNLSTSAEFPGKTYSTFYNVYRTGVYGGVVEDKTSGEDLSKFGFSASIAGWTGTAYTGACPVLALEVIPSSPTMFSSGTYNVSLSYSLVSEATEPSFTVTVNAFFYSNGTIGGPDAFGDNYLILASPGTAGKVGGTRTYCYLGACTTSAITGVAAPGLYGFSDNRVYHYYPYLDYNGIGYTISPAQPKTGAPAGTNLTTTVNPYVSKAGNFFEGFGSFSKTNPTYGTNPGGDADASQTTFNVGYVRVGA